MNAEKRLEQYKKVAADFRLLKNAIVQLSDDVQHIAPARELEKLNRISAKVDQQCSSIEESMFAEFPKLPFAYNHLFYGTLQSNRSDIDKEIISIAHQTCEKMF